ncbi:nitroreductase family protein [Microbispora sp. KK1-11]|uniref:nitroreductase family protein n=1 Tax=Microbispora sp. KK1-11 TaxID=2053005 RepID=UPI0011591011|nr:nitroreductase family protein [Microbispora sp. KK1-11]TQS29652.1 nitroreductase family protein [Microbispora sp. KK1-11]
MSQPEIPHNRSPLNLTTDELLGTTRAVRRRLDVTRPVPREVLLECTRLAQQAPSGRNRQRWDFVFVTDHDRRRALADLWRRGLTSPAAPQSHQGPSRHDFTAEAGWHAIADSLRHLVDILDQVPVLLVPCIRVGSRAELDDPATQAGTWGSVLPAVWSFMLAARSRGLGTVWTTPHLNYEREAATLLGLPYETTVQCALIPVAWTIGTDFKPARRVPVTEVVHWNHWQSAQ